MRLKDKIQWTPRTPRKQKDKVNQSFTVAGGTYPGLNGLSNIDKMCPKRCNSVNRFKFNLLQQLSFLSLFSQLLKLAAQMEKN
jgi:hypothetical protein